MDMRNERFDDFKAGLAKELDNCSCLEDLADFALMVLRDLSGFNSYHGFSFNDVIDDVRDHLSLFEEVF